MIFVFLDVLIIFIFCYFDVAREKKLHLLDNGASVEKISSNLEHEKPSVEESNTLPTKNSNQAHVNELDSLICFDETPETPYSDGDYKTALPTSCFS